MKIIMLSKKEHLDQYIKLGINHFLLPLKDYSTFYQEVYSLKDIIKLKDSYPSIHFFVLINKNIRNHELDQLKEIMIKLDSLKIKGIFFYDTAVLQLKKQLSLTVDLIWNETHKVTNSKSCDYYVEEGVSSGVLSTELTIKEMLMVTEHTKMKMILPLIYKPKVAYSKRKFITNYCQYHKENIKDTLLIEENVSKQNYSLRETEDGTSIVLENIVNGTLYMDFIIKSKIEYLLIEEVKKEEIMSQVIKQINQFFDEYQNKSFSYSLWRKKQEELLGTTSSLFDQETIFKVRSS